MTPYLLRRILEAIPALIGISIISFAVIATAPGDPAALLVDHSRLSEAERVAARRQLGLDDPCWSSTRGP